MNQRTMNLDQVAFLCGVSLERVRAWTKKGELRILTGGDQEGKIFASDVIDFLVKHNMPIPETIVPMNMRKVLFVYSDDFSSKKYLRFLINFYRQVKKNNLQFIADHTMYGPEAKMKVMVFKPHLVILDMTENERDASLVAKEIKELEELSSIRLLAIADPESLELKKVSAAKCGIDEVLPHCIEVAPLARHLLDLA